MLASFSLVCALEAHAEIQLLDRVVAIVDNSIIPQSKLDDRIKDIAIRSKANNVQLPPLSTLRSQVLEQLVLETLQLNTAQRYGVTVDDEEVIEQIRKLMTDRGINEVQLQQGLAEEGMTLNELKEDIRKQRTLQMISQGLVSSRIKVSESDIDSFLKSADAQFWMAPDYHLQHIFIPVSSSGGASVAQEAQEKANLVYESLIAGADFTQTAIAESKGPAALNGGDLGWRKSSELPTLFAKIAPTLALNDISKPARSQAGFHIIKLLETKGETKEIVTQTHARHILITPNELITKEDAQQKLLTFRNDILNGADFNLLAKNNSDDIGTKMEGGDLGWSNPGIFVAEFEEQMNTLEVGQISQPFASEFGWHILEVLERREGDLSKEAIRLRASNMLIGRRFEDEVQIWLQEMRDEAYVELKI